MTVTTTRVPNFVANTPINLPFSFQQQPAISWANNAWPFGQTGIEPGIWNSSIVNPFISPLHTGAMNPLFSQQFGHNLPINQLPFAQQILSQQLLSNCLPWNSSALSFNNLPVFNQLPWNNLPFNSISSLYNTTLPMNGLYNTIPGMGYNNFPMNTLPFVNGWNNPLSSVYGFGGQQVSPFGYNLPINNLPINGLPFQNLPFNQLPYPNLPYNNIPFNNLPYGNVPFNTQPFSGVPFTTPFNGLNQPFFGYNNSQPIWNSTPYFGSQVSPFGVPTPVDQQVAQQIAQQNACSTRNISNVGHNGFVAPFAYATPSAFTGAWGIPGAYFGGQYAQPTNVTGENIGIRRDAA